MIRKLIVIYLATFLVPLLSFAQEDNVEVPNEYESISIDDPEVVDFASTCNPNIEVEQIKKSIEESKNKRTIISIMAKKISRSMLLVVDSKVICQRLSRQGFPIIPIKEFDRTVTFPGMSQEQSLAFRTDISQQLAKSGTVVVRVINEVGNSTNIIYATQWRPVFSLRYDAIPHKGDKVDQMYTSTYNVIGGSEVIARSYGNKGEQKIKILGLSDPKSLQ